MIEPADAESLLVAEVRENFARLGLRDGVEFVPARERDALEARLAVAEAAIGLRPWLRRKLGRSAAR